MALKPTTGEIGIPTSRVDIFTKYPQSRFLLEASAPHVIDVRERLTSLFEAIDGLEDPHFGSEFDQDPFSRIWEMMVATILRNSGVQFDSSKGHGPDFIVNRLGTRIMVEAACPGLGQEGRPDSVPPLVPTEDYQLRPDDKMLLRIANAVAEKTRILEDYLRQGIIGSSDCCVIAVSSLKLNRARGRVPCLGISATLGHGLPYAAFDTISGQSAAEGFQSQITVQKTNGNGVSMTPFLDDSSSIVSGLLYSDASPYALNFRMEEDTYFIHNPRARNPLPIGAFRVGREYQSVVDEHTGYPVTSDVLVY